MHNYLESVLKQFEYYKRLGDNTFSQLNYYDANWQYKNESNNISIIVKHLAGNMLSRWTNFLTEDGEKTWRKRDEEFEGEYESKEEMINAWNTGWECLFDTLKSLNDKDLDTIIYIRNEGHSVTEAINRQLAHYAYHVGQIVFIAKQIKGKDWQTLSISKGESLSYNSKKFSKSKSRRHFTDDI